MGKDKWFKVFNLIALDTTNAGFIMFEGTRFNYQYIGDTKTRGDYLQIWSLEAGLKTHFSRVNIPENQSFLSFVEAESFHLAESLVYDSSWMR